MRFSIGVVSVWFHLPVSRTNNGREAGTLQAPGTEPGLDPSTGLLSPGAAQRLGAVMSETGEVPRLASGASGQRVQPRGPGVDGSVVSMGEERPSLPAVVMDTHWKGTLQGSGGVWEKCGGEGNRVSGALG